MNNLALRSITGAVFGLVMISTTFSPLWIQCTVFGIFMLQALLEFYGLASRRQAPHRGLGTMAGLIAYLVLCAIALGFLRQNHLALLLPLFLGHGILELWRKSDTPLENFALYGAGIIYITLPMFLLVVLSQQAINGLPLSLGMLALIWTNDSFAYFGGRLLGKHKLFERISPKKTWEGTLVGMLTTLVVGWAIANWQDPEHYFFWLVAGVLTSSSAILGDLLESLFKRSADVKDSGNILPGHGGVLDRFDAVLLASPFFYGWYVLYFN